MTATTALDRVLELWPWFRDEAWPWAIAQPLKYVVLALLFLLGWRLAGAWGARRKGSE